jgi:putative membrane protein
MDRFTAKVFVPLAVLAMAAGLTALRPSSTTAPAGASLDDPTIVAIFDAANTYDIETGSLASEKGSSLAVREFGEMLSRDHRNVRAQGRSLAASLKVTPTPPQGEFALAQAHAKAMKTLRSESGRGFDRAFLQHEVDFHNAVIDAVTKTLLPAIQNVQVKDFVTKVAPAFAAHRDAAQSLLDKQK